MSNSKHLSLKQEHYTPDDVIRRVWSVLEGIDLDPASCEAANQVVRADRYYTKEDNGLEKPWGRKYAAYTIFCNPPGGKQGNQSLTKLFWQKLMYEKDQGHIEQAIFLAFSVEALQTTQSENYPAMAEFPLCLPQKRLRFLDEDLEPQKSPTHANAIIYVPGTRCNTQGFYQSFKDLGSLLAPVC